MGIVGFIHTINLFESLEDICNEDNESVSCVGESLFFGAEDSNGDEACVVTTSLLSGGYDALICDSDNAAYNSLMNVAWRLQVFSLVPDQFLDNWTPLIFGIMALLQCVGGMQSHWL